MSNSQKHFIVCKASAGSGKTFKLVSDYLTLCFKSDSQYKFSRILAITFTNKAAAEMKERIIDHLRALSSEKNDSNYREEWMQHYVSKTKLPAEILQIKSSKILEAILHNYTSLSVSTIDTFTHRLIRSFARDLQIAADFEIKIDASENIHKSTDELISLAGINEEITEILENYIKYLTEEGSNWLPEKEIMNFGKQLLDEEASFHLKKIQNISHEEFKKIIDILNKNIREHESKLVEYAKDFENLCKVNSISESDFSYKSKGINRHFRYIHLGNYEDDKVLFTDGDYKLITNDSFLGKDIKKNIDPIVESKLKSFLIAFDEFTTTKQRRYNFYKILQKNIYNLSIIQKFNDKLKEINNTDNSILIAEFNKIVSEIISNDPAPFIYERIGERYHHILVDEFQDTSVLQFSNLIPLISNSLASNHTCLLVGDPKQAIYRWRGGDVDQFIKLPETNPYNKLIKDNYIEENLNQNFRSGKNIVQFNNQFFKSASSLLAPDYQPIYSDLHQSPVREGGYVELNLIPDKFEDPNEWFISQTIDKIKECLEDGYNYGDIALITRNKKEGKLLAQKFSELNIPAVSNESLMLSTSNEVELIMNFIHHLAHPSDPIAAFKSIELFYKVKGKPIPDSIYKRKPKEPFPIDQYLSDEGIQINRSEILSQTSYPLIVDLIRILLPGTQSVYIRFLVEYIYNYWKNSPTDAPGLCRWWNDHKEELSILSDSGTNAIRIMTVHGSKGLQFPVVIFPFANWKTKNGKDWIWVHLNDSKIPLELAVVKSNAKLLDNSDYSKLKKQEKDKSTLDDFNILYVAFTRPENRLYILAEEKDSMKLYASFLTSILHKSKDFTWISGDKEKYKSLKKSETGLLEIQTKEAGSKEERMRLSLSLQKGKQEQEELFELKKTGVFLHSVFEKKTNLQDALDYLEFQAQNDTVIHHHRERLKNEIKNVYDHPFLKTLFTDRNSINECSIVDESGDVYRPDKVVLNADSVILCDFKTGVFSEKHLTQMNNYSDLFLRMNYKSIKKYLFYTGKGELIEV